MKARIKTTEDVVEVSLSHIIYDGDKKIIWYNTSQGASFTEDELEFFDTEENFDYWTSLEHQYAGMAMQGMSEKYLKDYRDYCAGFGDMDKDEAKATMKDFADAMADVCYYFAHALVEKMKEADR